MNVLYKLHAPEDPGRGVPFFTTVKRKAIKACWIDGVQVYEYEVIEDVVAFVNKWAEEHAELESRFHQACRLLADQIRQGMHGLEPQNADEQAIVDFLYRYAPADLQRLYRMSDKR